MVKIFYNFCWNKNMHTINFFLFRAVEMWKNFVILTPIIWGSTFLIYLKKLISFWPFPSVRGGHSISSFFKVPCLQHSSPLHQLPPYLLSLHLKIFSLVSLFSSFPVTPFLSSFFLHILGLFS